MKRKRSAQIGFAVAVSLLFGWALGCTPEEQASVADALASSANAGISALLNFAVDFGRQALAAFLF
ncbi:MAG: hypothetical protein L6R00_15245 [Phycisphaerae bacterium]|nr:hypothetical protein [Phycisphaerae bacterium]